MTTILLLVTFAIGWALMVAGWRGRRVDDHPLCGVCGFDLIGKDPQSTRCSECGGDLNAPAAISDGHRVRRTAMLVTGLLLTMHSLLLLGATVFVAASGIDLTPHKPDWVLAREVMGPPSASAGKALAELLKRLQAGTTSDRNILSVARTCLAKQGQPKLVWDPAWGRFIEAARAAGKLTDEQWALYAQQAFVLSLEADPPALPPAALMPNAVWRAERTTASVTVRMNSARVAGASFVAFFEWAAIWIDDELPEPAERFGLAAPEPFHGRLTAGRVGLSSAQSVLQLPTNAGKRLAAGDHTLHGVLRLHIYDATKIPRQIGGPRTPGGAVKLTETGAELTLPFRAFEPVEPEHRDGPTALQPL